MKKPTKTSRESINFSDATAYIEQKYGIKTRGFLYPGELDYTGALNRALKELGYEYSEVANALEKSIPDYDSRIKIRERIYELARKYEAPYRNHWHTFCQQIHNGCYYSFATNEDLADDDNRTEENAWINYITKLYNDEFGDETQYWIAW